MFDIRSTPNFDTGSTSINFCPLGSFSHTIISHKSNLTASKNIFNPQKHQPRLCKTEQYQMDRYGSSARGRSYADEYDSYSESVHYGRSARDRAPSYSSEYDSYSEDDRYGRSARGHGHSGYNSYGGDDTSDDELSSSRYSRHAGPSSRHEDRCGNADLSRHHSRPMGREESDDDFRHTSSRNTGGLGSSHGHGRCDRGYDGVGSGRAYPGEDTDRSERIRNDDRPGRRYNERMRNHVSRGARSVDEDSYTGDSASDIFSDEESRYDMGVSGRHGSCRSDYSSRYESYGSTGPRDHVRGPRRTGGRIDNEDDSGSEGEYRYRGGRY